MIEMNKFAIAPREMLERKPKHGAPCNGCGLCCVVSRCQISKRLFGEGGRCPALVQTEEHVFSCGIVQSMSPNGDMPEEELHLAALLLIRAGEGCDARFNGEWINKEFHRQQDRADAKNRKSIKKAQKLWGIR